MLYTFDRSLARVRRQLTWMRSIPVAMEDDLFVAHPELSAWSVGEHLDHLAKVCRASLQQLARDEALDARPINAVGRVILALGWIPRGRGKSPERLRGAVGTRDGLEALVDEARDVLEAVAARPPRERKRPLLKHPVFGGLDANQSMRMLAVHNAHHLKIASEVARATRRTFGLP